MFTFFKKHVVFLLVTFLVLGCKKDKQTNNPDTNKVSRTAITDGFPLADILGLAISGDGRFVVITTKTSFAAADGDNFADVYRFDRTNNTMQLISTNLVSNAFSASISDNGERILYTASQSADLPLSPTAIYLWDNGNIITLQEGTQSPISPVPLITPLVAYTNVISPNGQVIGVNVDLQHIVFDLTTNQGTVISNGNPCDFSTDGRFHAWLNSDILSPGTQPSVWLYDRTNGNNIPITNGTKYADNPKISGDGRFVVFNSEDGGLTGAGDNNGLNDIFLFDQSVPKYIRITPADANGPSQSPDISADGNVITFSSMANNLGVADNNFTYDVFARINGKLVNITSGSDGSSPYAVLSNDGRFVVFVSDATNLGGTGTGTHVFVAGPLR